MFLLVIAAIKEVASMVKAIFLFLATPEGQILAANTRKNWESVSTNLSAWWGKVENLDPAKVNDFFSKFKAPELQQFGDQLKNFFGGDAR